MVTNRNSLGPERDADLDAQGQIELPRKLRIVAGLEGPVVALLGVGERIELWNPHGWFIERQKLEVERTAAAPTLR